MWSVPGLAVLAVVRVESGQLSGTEAVDACRGHCLAPVAVQLGPAGLGADPDRLAGLEIGGDVVECHGSSVVDS